MIMSSALRVLWIFPFHCLPDFILENEHNCFSCHVDYQCFAILQGAIFRYCRKRILMVDRVMNVSIGEK